MGGLLYVFDGSSEFVVDHVLLKKGYGYVIVNICRGEGDCGFIGGRGDGCCCCIN